MTTLDPDFGHLHSSTKIHLNPLSLVICLSRPGPRSSSSSHVVDSGIVWSMVGIPLVLTKVICIILSFMFEMKLSHRIHVLKLMSFADSFGHLKPLR